MPGIVEGGGGRCVCVGRSSKTAWCMSPWKESTPSRSECWHPGTWVPLIVDFFVYHLCRRQQVSDISWVSWATCLRRCSYPVHSVKHLFSVTQPHNKSQSRSFCNLGPGLQGKISILWLASSLRAWTPPWFLPTSCRSVLSLSWRSASEPGDQIQSVAGSAWFLWCWAAWGYSELACLPKYFIHFFNCFMEI